MAARRTPTLRYLAAGDVTAAMPPADERLELAELTMTALVSGAELPPKIGVHPRPDESFAHAMPAFVREAGRTGEPAGLHDGLGMKWVAGFPTNGGLGLPAIHALVILNDPLTGIPIAVLDGGPITAERTAAVSGVVIRRFARRRRDRPLRAAIIGAGIQGASHAEMLGHVLPGVGLTIHDRSVERATDLAARASAMPGIGATHVSATARDATISADVVVTAASFGPIRQVMTNDWLAPDALVVPVDYATFCSAEVARDAALFLVDERGQFLANRDAGLFDDYPDPVATIGEAILNATERPAHGRMVVSHLGVGLADVVFGRAILERAAVLGLGVELPR